MVNESIPIERLHNEEREWSGKGAKNERNCFWVYVYRQALSHPRLSSVFYCLVHTNFPMTTSIHFLSYSIWVLHIPQLWVLWTFWLRLNNLERNIAIEGSSFLSFGHIREFSREFGLHVTAWSNFKENSNLYYIFNRRQVDRRQAFTSFNSWTMINNEKFLIRLN